MIKIGRTVIMEIANYYPEKHTYGKVIEQLENEKVKIQWEDGTVSDVPEFWVGTFTNGNSKYF